MALGAAVYLVGCNYAYSPKPVKIPGVGALELCGRLSYEMYLFHMFLLLGMTKLVLSIFNPTNAVVVS